MTILLKSATLIAPNAKQLHLKKRDLLIKDGRIEKIAAKIDAPSKAKTITFPNLHVSTGWFDSGVSFGKVGLPACS